jgi:excisionase family DNA binding protein
MARETAPPDLLRPDEVAAMFGVAKDTVNRWAKAGRIPADQTVRTPGGALRYRAAYIRSLLAGGAR